VMEVFTSPCHNRSNRFSLGGIVPGFRNDATGRVAVKEGANGAPNRRPEENGAEKRSFFPRNAIKKNFLRGCFSKSAAQSRRKLGQSEAK
jgi:hypothetical protein